MLSPDNHLGIFAALMGLAAIAFWLQTTRIGALLTGTVMLILMAMVLLALMGLSRKSLLIPLRISGQLLQTIVLYI